MTHAAQAAARLIVATSDRIEGMRAAATAYGAAHTALTDAIDVVDTMKAAVTLIVAAEALKDQSDAAARAMRATLSEVIEATGIPAVQTEDHRAITADPPRYATISDEVLIPAEYWSRPHPDRTAIAKALREGIEVPGATLSNGGAPVLRITARKRV